MAKIAVYLAILLVSVGLAFELVRPAPTTSVRPPIARGHVTQQANPQASAAAVEPALGAPLPNAETSADLSDAACNEGMVFVRSGCARGASGASGADGACNDPLREFCIDRYEYPNLRGVLPAAMVHFEEAERACEAEGKRLCSDAEWTLACGAQAADAKGGCNLGSIAKAAEIGLLEAQEVAQAMANVDQRVPSGQMADCVSSSGAADLLGNVQEWVKSGHPGYKGGLKGGHFAVPTATCSAVTNVRQHLIRGPHNGFRCCADPLLELGGRGPAQR